MSQERKFARVDFEIDVSIEVDGKSYVARTVNISQGGALLSSDFNVPFGAKLALHVDIPAVKDTCTIPCVVRWSNGSELGVQFETLRPIEVWALGKLIKNK